MTNKPMLSVERELLESCWAALMQKGQVVKALELRAILDNPDECWCKRYGKDNPHWPCPIHSKPAAQHQGEPVESVQQYRVVRHDPREQKYSGWYEIESDAKREQIANSLALTGMSGAPAVYELRTLYAEQPAPVAVVMPERESFDIDDWAGSFCQEALSFGINQDVFARCVRSAISRTLAEVARLNGVNQ